MMEDISYKFYANDFISCRKVDGLEESYKVGRFLGEGAYGSVFACVDHETGVERAVKLFEKSACDSRVTREVIHEFQMLKELDHPNLIRIHELLEDENAYYIVTDLCEGGDMLDELGRLEDDNGDGGQLKEDDAAVLITNLLSCINYCHQKGLVHRDLKLENILLPPDSDYNNIKLIDFGLAAHFQVVNSSNSKKKKTTTDSRDDGITEDTTRRPSFLQRLSMGSSMGSMGGSMGSSSTEEEEQDKVAECTLRFSEIVGTPYYVAPEILEQDYGPKVDLWSLGVVAFMLLGGYAPFDGDDDQQILEAVVNRQFDFNDPNWLGVSQDAKDFVSHLLTHEDTRPTASQALQHQWLENHRLKKISQCRTRRASTHASLKRLSSFHSRGSILKQATCAMMASQQSHCSPQDIKDIGLAFQTLDKNCCGKLTKEDFKSSIAAITMMKKKQNKNKKKKFQQGNSGEYDSDTSNNSSSTTMTASLTVAEGSDSCSSLAVAAVAAEEPSSEQQVQVQHHHEGEREGEEEEEEEEEEFQFDIDGLFEQINFSRSGTINYSEFLGCCLMQKNVLEDTDKLVAVFDTYDRDNKGYITRSDLKDVLSSRGNSNVPDSTIDKIMYQTDRTGTGKITFEDFAHHILHDQQQTECTSTHAAAAAAAAAAVTSNSATTRTTSEEESEEKPRGQQQQQHRPLQRTTKFPAMPMMVRQLVYGRTPPPQPNESSKKSAAAKGA